MNINDLHAQGWTIGKIALATGWHRTTVSKYFKNGPPPQARPTEATVMTEHWQQRIASMLESWPKMQSVSIGAFATLADQARTEDWFHIEFLARLIAEQAAADRDRRRAARLRYARFPAAPATPGRRS